MTPCRIAVLVPMGVELRPVVRELRLQAGELGGRRVRQSGDGDVVATLLGMGTRPARAATRWLLGQGSFDHAVVIGVAGGVRPGLRIGDLIVPDRVIDAATGAEHKPAPLAADLGVEHGGTLLTTDELLTGPDRLAQLRDRGIDALDMEASAVAEVCDDAGVPWSVVRAMSDVLEDDLIDDDIFKLTGTDGKTDFGAVLRLVARRPTIVPRLVRLGRDLGKATGAAAHAGPRACEALRRSA